MKFFSVLTLFLGLSLSAEATEPAALTFSRNGKILKTWTLGELQKQFSSQELEITEPHMKAPKTFRGFDFKEVLTKVYGKNWNTARVLMASCTDGYRPMLQIKNLQNGLPFLAYGIKDEAAFKILKSGKETLLGPFYLVWSQPMTEPQRLQHLGAGNWPYQVQGFDLREGDQ